MCNFIFKPVIFVNFTEPLMINNKLSQHRNTEGLHSTAGNYETLVGQSFLIRIQKTRKGDIMIPLLAKVDCV